MARFLATIGFTIAEADEVQEFYRHHLTYLRDDSRDNRALYADILTRTYRPARILPHPRPNRQLWFPHHPTGGNNLSLSAAEYANDTRYDTVTGERHTAEMEVDEEEAVAAGTSSLPLPSPSSTALAAASTEAGEASMTDMPADAQATPMDEDENMQDGNPGSVTGSLDSTMPAQTSGDVVPAPSTSMESQAAMTSHTTGAAVSGSPAAHTTPH